MNDISVYLQQVLQKYQARDLKEYSEELKNLQSILKTWSGSCDLKLKGSGSRAKGTAISISSDVDILVSLSSSCNRKSSGLKGIYDSLYEQLKKNYTNVRKQNVSFRILLKDLEVDVTPARRHTNSVNDHWLYVSKKDTWQQTNIQKHISDISQSGRTNEIKLMKIWRELNNLDFPSIYLEYLMVDIILLNKSKDINNLADNLSFALTELAKDNGNPLNARIIDPANTNNILSDLLSQSEKIKITNASKLAILRNWNQVFY